jgi:DNA-binding IclR family transcriptional regulator
MPIKPAPAVVRAMQVLEFLAVENSAAPTLSEIARRTGMSKATCHSVLLALGEGGYVRRDPSSLVYSLGPGLITLGASAASSLRLPEIARSEMEALTDALGLTTVAAVSAGSHLVVISTVSPHQSFQVTMPIGQMVPFAPPLGGAFVAWAPKHEVDAWLDRAPRELSEGERQHFYSALAMAREHGYSVTLSDPRGREFAEAVEQAARHPESQEARSRRDELIGELGTTYLPASLETGRTYRLTQVSAPVFDHAGAVVMILLCVAVGLELATGQLEVYGQTVRRAADRLTQSIAPGPASTVKSTG